MDARTTPDRKSVAAARKDIETSTVELKDEMLTELLCRMYPLRVEPGQLAPKQQQDPESPVTDGALLRTRRRCGGT